MQNGQIHTQEVRLIPTLKTSDEIMAITSTPPANHYVVA